jgi:predicted RNA methylase
MQTPHWFLDELTHVGSEHVDANYVTGYDYKAGTGPTDDIALLRELGLNETHTLVDMGAGTGTFALASAPLPPRRHSRYFTCNAHDPERKGYTIGT